MYVAELYQTLADGELSNLSIVDEENHTILAAKRQKIIGYTNEALLRLYSRYVLKEQNLLLQLSEHITMYQLVPRYAVNYVPYGPSDDEPIRYIMDLPQEPFTGDVLKILSVFDTSGTKLPLNDDEDAVSLFSPQATVLQVPSPIYGEALSVSYQAKHTRLQDDLEEVIELPEVLFGALTSFIAYKVFSHMNTKESSNKAQEFLGTYEAICKEAIDRDLVNSSISASNSRFTSRGWI